MAQNWWDKYEPVMPPQGGIVTKPADPARAYEVPRVQGQIQGTALGNQGQAIQNTVAAETQDAEIRRKNAEARKTELEMQALERRAADPTGALGVDQLKAAGFYSRATKANEVFNKFNLGSRGILGEAAADIAPNLVNTQTSPERQQAEAVIRDFVAATLRYESGAAIPPSELVTQRKIYFPAPGDAEETLAMKAQLRANAIEALRIGSGPASSMAPGGITQSASLPPVTSEIGGQQLAPSTKTNMVEDPKARAVMLQVGRMVAGGVSDDAIIKFVKDAGMNPDDPRANLRSIFEMRRSPEFQRWQKANPGKAYPVSPESWQREESLSIPEGAISAVAQSAPGAFAGRWANAATAGLPAALAGDEGRQALDMMGQRLGPGMSMAADIGGGVAGMYGAGKALGVGAAAMGRTPGAGTQLLGDSLFGGVSGATSMPDNPGLGALTGAAAAGGGNLAGRGVVNAAARAISPSGGKLAPFYAEGGKPTIGQRMGGVFDRGEQAFASIPLVGGIQRGARNRAVEDWQAGAFNQALREVGAELPKGVKSGTAAHAHMQKAFNDAYDKARSGLTFRPDGDFSTDFGAIQQEITALSGQSQNTFANFAKEVGYRLRAGGGTLSGDGYKALVSRIEKKARGIRKNPQGDYELADALENLSIALDSGARRHSAPAAVSALDAADRGYVKAVLIEEAGRKAGGGEFGEFTGKQLEAAIRSNSGLRSRQALRGDAPLQDYAASGVRLGDSMPDSGTPERLMYGAGAAGAVGGLAHFVDPIMSSPWIANTLLNLPGGKQAVNALLSPNRKALDPARTFLEKRARLGGLITGSAAAAEAR